MLRECGDPHDDLFLEITVDGGAECLVTAVADLPEIGSISDALISDATWATLAERYDTRQLMEAVCTVVEVAPWSRIPETRAILVPRDD